MQAAQIVVPHAAHVVHILLVHMIGNKQVKMTAEVAFLNPQLPVVIVGGVYVPF